MAVEGLGRPLLNAFSQGATLHERARVSSAAEVRPIKLPPFMPVAVAYLGRQALPIQQSE